MRSFVCLLWILAVACGGAEPAQWQDLAQGPPAAFGLESPAFGGSPIELTGDSASWRVGAEIPPERFEDLGGGLFRTGLPVPSEGGLRLTIDGEVIPVLDPPQDGKRQDPELAQVELSKGILRWLEKRRRPGGLAVGPFLYLALDEGTQSPGVVRIDAEASAQAEGRLELGGLAANGFLVPPGGEVVRTASVPRGSTLRFQWSASGWLPGGNTELVVLDDDRELGRWSRALDGEETPQRVTLALAPGEHTLRFRIAGDASRAGVLLPRIAPAEIGRPDARPWDEERRDVLFLLADTYRADNLEAWGGDPRIAPKLNAVANESRRFLQARAPATWTLPSHAAFLCGMYPLQCGVREGDDRIPASAWTLAEHFAAAGYRTAAVTDRGFVSRAFGMDQGFEWFDEGQVDEERTVTAIERILAADDGRPLFLFVQSYRAHDPYRTRPYTAKRLGPDFRPRWTIKETLPYLTGYIRKGPRGVPFADEVAERAADYERHYRGASADLDFLFGVLLDRFETSGLRDNAVLCVTSDHGESFGQHGVVGHGSGVWDDQALVPLLLRAPGLTPGDDSHSSSLIDLPRTLTVLAGLPPHEEWLGQDLLAGSRENQPVFSFQARTVLGSIDVAVIHDLRKVILNEAEGDALRHAYALDTDPAELLDRAEQPELQRLRDDVEGALRAVRTPIFGREAATIDADQRANLDALGYGGDEED